MNKTKAEDDKIQAVSPESTCAWAFVDTKAIRKIKRDLIKTIPFFGFNSKFYLYNCKPTINII